VPVFMIIITRRWALTGGGWVGAEEPENLGRRGGRSWRGGEPRIKPTVPVVTAPRGKSSIIIVIIIIIIILLPF
jgi:hypothetical protein